MRKKRGQVTIFIILGIVLLFSTALIIFIRSQIAEVKPPPTPTLEKIPSELEPIRTYVSSCIEQTAADGLIKLGQQGGYLNTQSLTYNEFSPTEGEAIGFPGTNIKMPYWWYMKSSNDCTSCRFASEKPALADIQKDLADYVADNLQYCIGDFEEFVQQGFSIRILDQIKPQVTFDQQTNILVEWPLEITKAGSVAQIKMYFASVPINFRKIYNFASSIAAAQANNTFLEKQTMHVLGGFMGLDKEKLPPIAASEFKPGNPLRWLKTDVKTDVVSLIQAYIPLLQIFNSYNFIPRIFQDPIRQGTYDVATIPVGATIEDPLNQNENTSVNFLYLDVWPAYFNIDGRGVSGEVIGPESTSSSFFPWLGIQRYNFFYQISYPVIVELRDARALKGRGYSFKFGLEANLRDNKPVVGDITALAAAEDTSLLCDPGQRNSGEIGITTVDTQDKAVDEVQIIYSCGDESCAIGYTSLTGDKAVLVDRLPVCAGGAIIATKQDYSTAPISYNAQLDVSDNFTIVLEPVREKNITVRKKPFLKTANFSGTGTTPSVTEIWTFTNQELRLLPDEQVLLILEKVKEDPGEEEFTQSIVFSGNESFETVQLVPGRYKITSQLLWNRKVIIPEEEICYPDDWYDTLGLGDEKCEKIPEIVFNETFFRGGLKVDEAIGYWTLDADTLDDPKPLVFYVYSSPDGFTLDSFGKSNLKHDDLDQLGKLDEYSQQYWPNLLPRLQ